MQLTGICVYPIKSCAGLTPEHVVVTPRGLQGDRRWMAVRPGGRFVTAREVPRMVRIAVEFTDAGLRLTAPGQQALEVSRPGHAAPVEVVSVWDDNAPCVDAGDAAAAWLGEFLQCECRLVYQRDTDLRSIAARPGGRPGDHVSFADGYPVLLIGSASLRDLNGRLDRSVTMARFRPNLVVETDAPFCEDRWKQIRIGEVTFESARRCSRCVLTTVDPLTGEKDSSGEPLRTLREFRFDRQARGILFGINLIPRSTGTLAKGDSVEVLDPASD